MEKVKQFYDAMANNEAIMERAAALNESFAGAEPEEGAVAAEIIAFAAKEGYDFTAEELAAYGEKVKKESARIVSEEELSAVAGGQRDRCSPCFNVCGCVVGGGGRHFRPDYLCVCVIGGGGGRCPTGWQLICPIGGSVNHYEDFRI